MSDRIATASFKYRYQIRLHVLDIQLGTPLLLHNLNHVGLIFIDL